MRKRLLLLWWRSSSCGGGHPTDSVVLVTGRPIAVISYALSIESVKGRIAVRGTAGTNSQHTINEDERRSFTDHINAVLAGDPDVGHLLPIPTDTMQLFDEVRGE